MKKLLAILLVIAMAATLFAGCSDPSESPSENPTPTTDVFPSATPDATPTPEEPPKNQVPTLDKIIEFNVYDYNSHEAGYWGPATQDYLLANYKLKVGLPVNPVGSNDISTSAGRTAYAADIARLFETTSNAPDFFGTLLAPDTGVDAVFKSLGTSQYLVDFNDYLGEGKVLSNYVDWLWNGDEALWESYKKSLLASDGGLYALPKYNALTVSKMLMYNRETLDAMGIGRDTWWTEGTLPTDWDEFVGFLKDAKSVRATDIDEDKGHEYTPFVNRGATLDSILPFLTAAYGLEWNAAYDWTVKNGEPLWSYAWDEYQLALNELLSWVELGLVPHDIGEEKGGYYKGNGKVLAGYNGITDEGQDQYKDQKLLSERLSKNALAIWMDPGNGFGPANMNDHRDTIAYRLATVIPAHEGYEASLTSATHMDTKYIAISRRQEAQYGDELALRLMMYLNETLTEEGYFNYSFGREGIPYADSRELAGNYLWVDNFVNQYGEDEGRKIILTYQEDWRWERAADAGYTVEDFYAQLDTKDGYGAENYDKYKYANMFLKELPISYGEWFGGEYKEVKDDNSVKVKLWNGRMNYFNGMYWYKDPTDYKMQYTIYWQRESFAHDYQNWIDMTREFEASGHMIYQGLFADPAQALGGLQGNEMKTKIENLKTLAKNFTMNVLSSGASTVSGWANYIKSLNDAGYMDVYNYYDTVGTLSFQSKFDSSIKSSTWMHESSENAGYYD